MIQMMLGRSAAVGALPLLYQATGPAARATDYVVGTKWPRPPHPAVEAFPARACDAAVAARLWEKSVELTGVDFGALAGATPNSGEADARRKAIISSKG